MKLKTSLLATLLLLSVFVATENAHAQFKPDSVVESGETKVHFYSGLTEKNDAQKLADALAKPPLSLAFEGSSSILVANQGEYIVRVVGDVTPDPEQMDGPPVIRLLVRVMSDVAFAGRPCVLEYWWDGERKQTIKPGPAIGKLITLHNNSIFYSGDATEKDAQKVAEHFEKLGTFTENSQSFVRVDRAPNETTLTLVTRDLPQAQMDAFGIARASYFNEVVFPERPLKFVAAAPGLVPRPNLHWMYDSDIHYAHQRDRGQLMIRYTDEIDERVVQALMKRLVDPGPERSCHIRLSINDNVVQCRFTAPRNQGERNAQNVTYATRIGSDVRAEFPQDVELDFVFCDTTGQPVWKQRVDQRNDQYLASGKSRLKFQGGITRKEARELADWFAAQGLFGEPAASSIRYAKEGDAYIVQLEAVREDLTPETVKLVEEIAQELYEEKFSDALFQFQLVDMNQEIIDDNYWSSRHQES